MGIFRKEPTKAEVNAFARSRRGSGKVAEAYAQRERDKLATRRAVAERRAAERRAAKKGK